jgi:ketosteroid isomerase-like protein
MKALLFTFLLIPATSFLRGQQIDPDPAILVKTDKSFSDYSVSNGFARAFITYADEQVIKMINNSFPIIGKQQLMDKFGKNSGSNRSVLSWSPVKAEIAKSGDMGYTFGNYQFKVGLALGRDTIYYGNYVTIWRKQRDGSWKYILDGGNATPAPSARK